MFEDPRYHVIVGAGSALLLTSQHNSLCEFSLIVSGLLFGLMEMLWTSTVYINQLKPDSKLDFISPKHKISIDISI